MLKEETNNIQGVPFYKIGTFGGKADVFIDKIKFNLYKKQFPYPQIGDILISAAGTIGRAVIYNGEEAYYQDSNIVWIENNEEKVLNRFLYYKYKSIKWNISKGSTILRLYNDDIRNTSIYVPSLSMQDKIVKILSCIDKKIKLNNQINHNLPILDHSLKEGEVHLAA